MRWETLGRRVFCKHNLYTARSKRDGGRWGQRSAASRASEGRGIAATSLNKKRQSGRWGVVPASQHREILVALASLIRAQRYEMALTILGNELEG